MQQRDAVPCQKSGDTNMSSGAESFFEPRSGVIESKEETHDLNRIKLREVKMQHGGSADDVL